MRGARCGQRQLCPSNLQTPFAAPPNYYTHMLQCPLLCIRSSNLWDLNGDDLGIYLLSPSKSLRSFTFPNHLLASDGNRLAILSQTSPLFSAIMSSIPAYLILLTLSPFILAYPRPGGPAKSGTDRLDSPKASQSARPPPPTPNNGPLYISPTDDSRRVISVTMDATHGQNETGDALVCMTKPPDDVMRNRHMTLEHARAIEATGNDSMVAAMKLHKRADTRSLVVETYFHLVTTRDQSRFFSPATRTQVVNNQVRILSSLSYSPATSSHCYMKEQAAKTQCLKQGAALNLAYRAAGIIFHINRASYTINDGWATDANSAGMKKALRRGGYGALNIYFQSNLTSDPGSPSSSVLLGYCTLPTKITYTWNGMTYTYPAADYATDGCNVLAGSMPGSPNAVYGYDRGKTAVHEVGHWFGLLHTFQVGSELFFSLPLASCSFIGVVGGAVVLGAKEQPERISRHSISNGAHNCDKNRTTPATPTPLAITSPTHPSKPPAPSAAPPVKTAVRTYQAWIPSTTTWTTRPISGMCNLYLISS